MIEDIPDRGECPECGVMLKIRTRDNTDCRMSHWWREEVAECPICRSEWVVGRSDK